MVLNCFFLLVLSQDIFLELANLNKMAEIFNAS